MKKLLALTIAYFLILLLAGYAVPKKNPTGDSVTRPRVVAYLPSWKLPYTPQWEKVTHLCLAFGVVGTDGSLDTREFSKFKHVIKQARKNKVKVLISIGGGGSKNFSAALLDENRRQLLTNNIVRSIKKYKLDGVDVDFEEWQGGPGGASDTDIQKREALTALYRDLRTELGPKKLITAAVNADWDDGGRGVYNCFSNSMHEYLDFVSLMIYDETGPWSGTRTGPHSSWTFFENAINHWLKNRNIPKDKLVPGVPFYGYIFPSQNVAKGAKSMAYRNILTTYPDIEAHQTDSIGLLYYDGMPTMQKKAEYIRNHNLGGIMIWEITHDTDDPEKSLLNVIHNTFHAN